MDNQKINNLSAEGGQKAMEGMGTGSTEFEMLKRPEEREKLEIKKCDLEQVVETPRLSLADTLPIGDDLDIPAETMASLVKRNDRITLLPGMKNIRGAFNDVLFSRVTLDANGGREIEVYQKYSDGSFSPKIKVKQSELLRAVMAEDPRNKTVGKGELKKAEKFFMKMEEEYLGKICIGMAEMLNMHEVLKVVAAIMPTVRTPQNSIAELKNIELLRRILNETRFMKAPEFEEHKYFYAFSEDAFSYVAEHIGINRICLLETLEKGELLYLVDSSLQYKTNVRIHNGKTDTAWRYCVRKIYSLDDGDEDLMGYDF